MGRKPPNKNGVTLITGGQDDTPSIDLDEPLARDLKELLDNVIQDMSTGIAIYQSITNTYWSRDDYLVLYSFRAAGDLIAALREEGTYLDWYCCARAGIVHPWLADLLATRGWKYRSY